jgi:AcrR family transcriptional regulator
MRTPLRAVGAEDKEARGNAILDAVEELYLRHPDRMASVAEVAEAAKLAKGTVYLYFPSKEEMLLALHERHVDAFFTELAALLRRAPSLTFAEIFEVARRLIIRRPGYLDLTARCLGLMDREVPVERALEFKMRVGQMLARCGAELERHFTRLAPGEGVGLLCNSYGLMVGLWQLMHPNQRFGAAMQRPEMRMFRRDYETEVERAVLALWTGVIESPARPATKPAPKRKAR